MFLSLGLKMEHCLFNHWFPSSINTAIYSSSVKYWCIFSESYLYTVIGEDMNLTCMKTTENTAYSLLYFYSEVFTQFFAYCSIFPL